MAASPSKPNSRNEFDILIICVLRIESDAVEASFDHFWDDLETDQFEKVLGHQKSYNLGTISGHNAVIVYTPGMGKSAAASVAASCRVNFPYLRLALVVGICGGVPNSVDHDQPIFLGDVVVSTAIVQYDFGRQYADRIVRKDSHEDVLARPSVEVRAFMRRIQGWRNYTKIYERVSTNIAAICHQQGFHTWNRPVHGDKLYPSTYRHKHHQPTECTVCAVCELPEDPVCETALNSTCEELKCSESEAMLPNQRWPDAESLAADNRSGQSRSPRIHFGRIASGDTVMKSSTHRDRIANEDKVLAFEMEAAGVWDNLPTIIIKGVSDYADSHKDKSWQKYAAVTAAACAKAILCDWTSIEKPTRAQSQSQSQSSSVFHNYGTVHNQAQNQTNHGPMYFGQVVQNQVANAPDRESFASGKRFRSEISDDYDFASQRSSTFSTISGDVND